MGLTGHDRPQHFAASPAGGDGPVWAERAREADRLVGGPKAALVIDGTGLPKRGTLPAGVARCRTG